MEIFDFVCYLYQSWVSFALRMGDVVSSHLIGGAMPTRADCAWGVRYLPLVPGTTNHSYSLLPRSYQNKTGGS